MSYRSRIVGNHIRNHMNRAVMSAGAVPTLAQVRVGAYVSIVLKADQRTGREVQGQVKDLLTRGNHPRGIKVRLQDGRIGRVQRMVDPGTAAAAANTDTIETPDILVASQEALQNSSQRNTAGRGQRFHSRDVRYEQHYDQEQTPQADLMSYVRPAVKRKGRKKTVDPDILESRDSIITCPVCGNFTGDESAVNHHVETHFKES